MVMLHNDVKKEMLYIFILLLIETISLKIIFYKESFLITLKLALSFFWLFIFPGFMLMYLFVENLDFIERTIAGIALGMAFFGVLGYNLGVLGLLIKHQIWILPIIGIGIGIFALIKKKRITF